MTSPEFLILREIMWMLMGTALMVGLSIMFLKVDKRKFNKKSLLGEIGLLKKKKEG